MKQSWMLSSLSTSSIIFLHFFSTKCWIVSANGNLKANVAVVYKGLGGEQRTEVCEGGMSSEQALCGRVRLGRRETLDENWSSLRSRPASSLRTRLMSESTSSATESLALLQPSSAYATAQASWLCDWRGCGPIGDVC